MDTQAYNYNSEANSEDNSCVYSGCTAPAANNYDSEATIENGTCLYDDDLDGIETILSL